MKSIIFKQTGSWMDVLELDETNIKNPNDDEVQIKVVARPVNPSDEMFIQGVYRQKPSLPQIAGLEGAGIIEKCGQDIEKSLLGKHIAFRAKGTWTEKINLKVGDFRIVPDSIPFEIACQLSLNTLTAYALLDKAALRENQWLLLTAANSSVCQQIIQIAKQRKINIVAVVRKDEHKEKLLSLGATFIVNADNQDLIKEVSDKIDNGVNVSIDAVGGEIGSKLFKVAASNSKIIIYGRLSNDLVSFSNGDVIYRNLQLQGFGIDSWINSKSVDEINSIWETILLSITRDTLKVHYDKVYPLYDFKQAIKTYKETNDRTILK